MRLAGLLGGAGVVLAATAASAQINDCNGLGTTGGPAVLLDEVWETDGAGKPISGDPLLMAGLEHSLKATLRQLGPNLRLARCVNRRPRGDADFTADLVRRLEDRGALLELWGYLGRGDATGGGRDLLLGYVVLPARRMELVRGTPPGVYKAVIRRTGDPLETLIEIFGHGDELHAYANLAFGMREFRDGHYEEAYSLLCKGVLRLWPTGPAPSPDHEALLTRALAMAAESVQKAAAHPPSVVAVVAAGSGACGKP